MSNKLQKLFWQRKGVFKKIHYTQKFIPQLYSLASRNANVNFFWVFAFLCKIANKKTKKYFVIRKSEYKIMIFFF